jgi:hypothetical protein
MVKMFETYTLLDITGTTTGAVTPLSYGRTDKSSVQVDISNSGAGTTTVVIEGTNAATSTGSYVQLDSTTFTTTGAGTKSYAGSIVSPFTFVKVRATAIGTTASTVKATITTQGEGY